MFMNTRQQVIVNLRSQYVTQYHQIDRKSVQILLLITVNSSTQNEIVSHTIFKLQLKYFIP